jgi:hypothetical protein
VLTTTDTRLGVLLREALPQHEIARLNHLGAQLSEDQAITMVLEDSKDSYAILPSLEMGEC